MQAALYERFAPKMYGVCLRYTSDQEEAQEELEVNYSGDALDIGFNVNYLLDVLNNVPGTQLECAFGDSSSSALISYGSEKGFKYVVMPMRI